MHVSEWIAIIAPAMAIAAAGYTAVAKLTRMTVAIEDLVRSMAKVSETLGDHGDRLSKLEKRRRGRHEIR